MAKSTTASPPPGEQIRPTPLAEALSERYLSYALSTIMSRSLPDVRDGLKPVHRRLLHAMRQLRLDPDQGFKKCARIVGDVMGKYHPHGDAAIYDALVRLAQSFAARRCLRGPGRGLRLLDVSTPRPFMEQQDGPDGEHLQDRKRQ